MRTLQYGMRSTETKDLRKSVFELSAEELTERILPTAERVTKDAWDKGLYITYFDKNLCPAEDMMIHEYRDRKELVRVLGVGRVELIKIL